MESSTIRVVLADDHSIVRGGIKSLVDEVGIEIVGEASNGQEALALVEQNNPDILISDVSMTKMNGLELTQIVSCRFSNTKVLILTMHNEQEYVLKGYKAGAMGYLLKNSGVNEIVNAIRAIHSGQKYLTPEISEILAESVINEKPVVHEKYNLTRREKEILNMLVNGSSNKMIAAELFLSIRTVDTHRSNIMKKMKVKNVADLVRLCLKENIQA